MRMLISVLVFLCFLTTPMHSYADRIYEELLSAIEDDGGGKFLTPEKVYTGRIISGEAYVESAEFDNSTGGFTIELVKDPELPSLFPNLIIEVDEDSPYLERARNLSKGEKIFFSGRFDRIFSNSIWIKQDVIIRPQ